MPTGIAGLDLVLNGGLDPGPVVGLAGAPGTGKTILAQQICFAQMWSGSSLAETRSSAWSAVLAGQSDEWTESRRYMGLDILAACRKAIRHDMGRNITSEAGLTVEAIPG